MTIKHRLINDNYSKTGQKAQKFEKSQKIQHIFKFLLVGRLIASLVFISLPYSVANADLASFFSAIFGDSVKASNVSFNQNSQKMPILRAPLNIDTNPSVGGGDITIVDNSALASESGFIEGENPVAGESSGISLYVVREGDSLSQIARMFKVSTNTIIWANDLKGAVISPGQQLVILPISGVKHIVKKGETLQGIVTKYKADLAETLKYNDISINSKLAVGDEVIIPDAELSTISSSGSSPKTSTQFSSYPNYSGYFVSPISHYVRTQGIHGYNAVDLAAPIGTPIVAAASGNVIISRDGGWNGGYGSYVVISHPNGTQTLYSHMSRVLVYSGSVVQGQVIGYVGVTGKATGSHLHFEIRGAKNPF